MKYIKIFSKPIISYFSIASASTVIAVTYFSVEAESTDIHTESKGEAQHIQKSSPGFKQVDLDENGELVWSEIHAIFDDELASVSWDGDKVFSDFDANKDNYINDSEYLSFVERLGENSKLAEHETQSFDSLGMEKDISYMREKVLKGRKVINMRGQVVGEVEEVVIGPNDEKIQGLVVGVDNYWDLGDKDIYVSVNELHSFEQHIVWRNELSEEALDGTRAYKYAEQYSTNVH